MDESMQIQRHEMILERIITCEKAALRPGREECGGGSRRAAQVRQIVTETNKFVDS